MWNLIRPIKSKRSRKQQMIIRLISLNRVRINIIKNLLKGEINKY